MPSVEMVAHFFMDQHITAFQSWTADHIHGTQFGFLMLRHAVCIPKFFQHGSKKTFTAAFYHSTSFSMGALIFPFVFSISTLLVTTTHTISKTPLFQVV